MYIDQEYDIYHSQGIILKNTVLTSTYGTRCVNILKVVSTIDFFSSHCPYPPLLGTLCSTASHHLPQNQHHVSPNSSFYIH